MLDTSLIEAKIRKTVSELCFESIVSEAFIAGLPLPEAELTDGLTQRFAQYATECLKDLGSIELLKSALESEKNPMKRNYLQSMYTLCMETATDVTARILAENKDDKALKEAAANVTFTKGEYDRFSKAAATLTPTSLTNMIQKKALDTIKEEKEAHQRDQELEQELKDALADEPTPPAETASDIPSPDAMEPTTPAESTESTDAELENAAVPPAMDGDPQSSDGATIGTGSTESWVSGAYEGWLGDKLAAMQARSAERTQQQAIRAAEREEERLQKKSKGEIQRKKIDKWVESKSPVLKSLLNMAKSKGVNDGIIASIQKAMDSGPLDDVDYYNITIIDDISAAEAGQAAANTMMLIFAITGDTNLYNATVSATNYYNGKQKQINYGKTLKGEEAFESFMQSIAGKNYRAKHATVFSRLQELAYESILSTTEKYNEIPFETMSLITRQNTFGRFGSHWSKSVESMMDSIGRYAFESAGVDVPAPVKEEQLNSALLTASIIYTFFETLNSMNLYCPKLAEIKDFVDETLPIESRVELDKSGFMNLFKGIMAKAQSNANRAMSVPEVDAVQGDLDIVRERCSAPGFESMRQEINTRIGQVQESINARRDYLIAKQKPQEPVVESATQLMRRERDTMKFTNFAGTTAAKPNVSYTKIKIDPQAGSSYVAVECYGADNRIVGKRTIVLEGATADLPGYVQAAVEGSRLPELHKRVMITDKRSGKVLFDKNWYGR